MLRNYVGQDSWNLQYGKRHPAKTRKGAEVDMHPDEGFNGPKMVPGYAGAYKNWKGKALKANGNPKNFGPDPYRPAHKSRRENGEFENVAPKRRK